MHSAHNVQRQLTHSLSVCKRVIPISMGKKRNECVNQFDREKYLSILNVTLVILAKLLCKSTGIFSHFEEKKNNLFGNL